MFTKIKRLLIGRPLNSDSLSNEKYTVFWGLPILASDAISSVAYAGQEILIVLIPVIGILSYHYMLFISLCIIALLAILVFSYRQTIESYPNGGGAYIVAKDNLGTFPGVTAGAALAIDYVLTVAVSISSGVEQIASAFEVLRPYSVEISVFLAVLLMVGNLRGIRESSKMFGAPTYLFIFSMLLLLVTGFIRAAAGIPPEQHPIEPKHFDPVTVVPMFLLLRAFSNGCAALTGVEAVSNAIPNFREPSRDRAKKVLLLLSFIILVIFGGIAVLTFIYHANPVNVDQAVIIQLADMVFGRGTLLGAIPFYMVTATVFLILILAANTAFADFPMLISIISKDDFLPRQFRNRGERLSFSNGIIFLTVFAAALIVIFNADVSKLIGLYAIGVFISFTLSQSGMFVRWIKKKGKGWHIKAIINGLGAIVTFIVVIIVAITKFSEGAYIVMIAIPLLVFFMMRIKRHYFAVGKQLKVREDVLEDFDIGNIKYRNRVIVPIASINRSSIRAIRYAKTISDNIVVFSVVLDKEREKKLREDYAKLNIDIPLTVWNSPYRKIVDPLLKYIESEEYKYQPGDIITVLLPEFAVKKRWHNMLHNHTRLFISRELLKHKHIVISTIPLQLRDDNEILRSPKYNPEGDSPWK
jgi:amino acid transporter